MIKIISYNNYDDIKKIQDRSEEDNSEIENIVFEILKDVRVNGDSGVIKYNKKFDNCDVENLELTKDAMEIGFNKTDREFIEILKEAKKNIESYHENQKKSGYLITEESGVVLGQRVTPIDRVGVYVPGGTASYPSSVLMNVIPAKIAGVKEIIMVTPPDKYGNINSDILTAAKIAGVDKIFKTGGAQAIGALAYGTETIPKVDKIVGPGNIFVATAKKMIFGKVDIDMVAGPSEILIIADGKANPLHTAVDLLSQAEHDKNSASYLITDDKNFAEKVKESLEIEIEKLSRNEIAREAIEKNGYIIVVENLEIAAEVSNYIAPEHLVINIKEPLSILSSIKHAGSIFLGAYSPEALGDYFAGPNHVLPTNGTARFSSGLSVDDFIKKSSIIYYNKSALEKVGDKIIKFANREGLEAHGKSISIRMERDDKYE